MKKYTFEIGDVVQAKEEYIFDDQTQESTVRIVVDYQPNIDYLLLCGLNQPNKKVHTRGEYYELVKKGNNETKDIASDIIKTLPSEEEKEKELCDLRNYILSIK